MSRRKSKVRKMEMRNYLFANNREDTPDWLKKFKPGDKLNYRNVFSSASVMYPGCGDDGRAIKLFSQAHAAHLFYYVDCGMSPENWKQNLEEIPVKGYHILDARELIRRDLNIHRKTAPVVSGLGLRKRDRNELTPFEQFLLDQRYFFNPENPVCYFVVFERDEEMDDSYGVDRFAVAFICQDAILFYALFFFWSWIPAPTWIVIQSDMETIGLFGRGEPLEQAAITIRKLPKYLLVGYNTEAWQNYTEVDNVWPRTKWMPRSPHGFSRLNGKSWRLYRRNDTLLDDRVSAYSP